MAAKAEKDNYVPKQARVAEIAAMLPATPAGPGRPIDDRTFWAHVALDPVLKSQVEAARKLKNEPLPPVPDDLFLQFSQNGNRHNYERVAFSRRNRLAPLVLAECIENTGEFLPAIQTLIVELCKTRTWVLPAHDKQLTNFNNTKITIDLFSSALAWDLSMADYLLGARLNPQVRSMAQGEVMRRVVGPFQASIRGERDFDHWVTHPNNWNPVCLSGITGAALIHVNSAKDRAAFIATAEYYSRYFLEGFTRDGYCSEGIGYWNYGYGRYAIMAQNFRLQTGGEIDLFTKGGAAAPASYGPKIAIINNAYPAFADCSLSAKPNPALLNLLNGVYGWNDAQYAANPGTANTVASLFEAMLYHSWRAQPAAPVQGVSISGASGLRSVFQDAGVFICRPNAHGTGNFGVAFKGGHNDEHHNHNDIGSYVVVIGDTSIFVDPGPEAYTRRTFTKDRYESKVLNSFGHSVPVVAGKLQRKGSKAEAKILKQEFTETTDTVVMEISSAYGVPPLQSLKRTFEYGRTGDGILVITDEVEFKRPRKLESAMISLGDFQHKGMGPGEFLVKKGDTAADISIEATAPYAMGIEKIDQEGTAKPNRLRVRLTEPVKSAKIKMIIKPKNAPIK